MIAFMTVSLSIERASVNVNELVCLSKRKTDEQDKQLNVCTIRGDKLRGTRLNTIDEDNGARRPRTF